VGGCAPGANALGEQQLGGAVTRVKESTFLEGCTFRPEKQLRKWVKTFLEIAILGPQNRREIG